MWVAAGPTSTFLPRLKMGQGQKPPLWVCSKLSLASRKLYCQITTAIHSFTFQDQRSKDILMSPLSTPCKRPTTGQGSQDATAKARLPAGHGRSVHILIKPYSELQKLKGLHTAKNQGDCTPTRSFFATAEHLPLKMSNGVVVSRGKQNLEVTESSRGADTGFHVEMALSTVSQPVNGKPQKQSQRA